MGENGGNSPGPCGLRRVRSSSTIYSEGSLTIRPPPGAHGHESAPPEVSLKSPDPPAVTFMLTFFAPKKPFKKGHRNDAPGGPFQDPLGHPLGTKNHPKIYPKTMPLPVIVLGANVVHRGSLFGPFWYPFRASGQKNREPTKHERKRMRSNEKHGKNNCAPQTAPKNTEKQKFKKNSGTPQSNYLWKP